MKIPEGYTHIRHGRATLVIKEDYMGCLLEQGITDPGSLIQSSRASGGSRYGRGAVPSVPVRGKQDERMIIRQYLRGGLLRFLNKDLYFGSRRPFLELCLTVAAARTGIPTVDILAAVALKSSGPLYRGYLVSKELSACIDLPGYLAAMGQHASEELRSKKQFILREAAQVIRLMHDRGVYHGDLNMKNILVDTAHPENIYIIDWDKSCARSRLTHAQRRANVLRFCRSMAKLARQGAPVTGSDISFFLSAYWEGNQKKVQQDLLRLRISVAARSLLWARPLKQKNI